MPTRTYKAFGLGWDTWIELTGEPTGPIVLTRSDGKPHAYAKDADEANGPRFNAAKGHAIDRVKGQPNTVSFEQTFSEEVLEEIKVISRQVYPTPAIATTSESTSESSSSSTEAAPTPPRRAARRRASGE